MVIKKYTLIIILFSITGCKAQQNWGFRKIVSTSCFLESSIALSKGSIRIYQNILDKDGSFADQIYYSRYFWDGNSMQKKINKDLFTPTKLDSLNEMRKSEFFIENIDGHKFKYDTSEEQMNQKSIILEKYQKCKYFSNNSVCLIRDSSFRKKISYQIENEKEIVLDLRQDYLESDFLLYDLVGDGNPEVFVVTKSYIGGHYIFDIVVYQIAEL